MRVSVVTNANYGRFDLRKHHSLKNKLNENPVAADTVAFKGGKGAAIGAGAGLVWLGAMAAVSGPFLPVTLGVVAACAGAGALAGHNIEEEYKNDRENDDK